MASPTVRDEDILDELHQSLAKPQDPVTLETIMAEIEAGVKGGVED